MIQNECYTSYWRILDQSMAVAIIILPLYIRNVWWERCTLFHQGLRMHQLSTNYFTNDYFLFHQKGATA